MRAAICARFRATSAGGSVAVAAAAGSGGGPGSGGSAQAVEIEGGLAPSVEETRQIDGNPRAPERSQGQQQADEAPARAVERNGQAIGLGQNLFHEIGQHRSGAYLKVDAGTRRV